jgi:hypothetical protein
MQTTEPAEPRVTDERALAPFGAALFAVGALMVLLFVEQVIRWHLVGRSTTRRASRLVASWRAWGTLLVAGLIRRRR